RHAAGSIDEQMGVQVGFFLVFLDVIAVGLAEDAPVDVANLVAGIILAMLGELDAEALVGAFVNAAEEALDDVARDEAEPAILGERGGIEEGFGGGHCVPQAACGLAFALKRQVPGASARALSRKRDHVRNT